KDGVSRVADIKTATGTVRRAFTKICPLLPQENDTSLEAGASKVYVFLLLAILEGFHCRPTDTDLNYERHHQLNILGIKFNVYKQTSRTNTLLARILGRLIPQDTQFGYQRDLSFGIPDVLELKGHKAISLENYER
ncbi:hypothetical protein B5X24_HaOG206895, partial [Helicoverpa armigera]